VVNFNFPITHPMFRVVAANYATGASGPLVYKHISIYTDILCFGSVRYRIRGVNRTYDIQKADDIDIALYTDITLMRVGVLSATGDKTPFFPATRKEFGSEKLATCRNIPKQAKQEG
jgi:hypothetical protein